MSIDLPVAKIFEKSTSNFYIIGTLCAGMHLNTNRGCQVKGTCLNANGIQLGWANVLRDQPVLYPEDPKPPLGACAPS